MSSTLADAARRLHVVREGVAIPAVYWAPADACKGIVVACHGGSGHKLSQAVLAIAGVSLPLGLAVLAIDGPVHGERRCAGCAHRGEDELQPFDGCPVGDAGSP